MKTLVKSLLITLLTLLLICSSSAPTYGRAGDDPTIPQEFPAQDLRFQHLTTEDGLSEGRVWGITRERQGFMWFTTWAWIHLIIGIVVLVAGFGLFSSAVWARIVGVIIAVLAALESFAWLPYYPGWAILFIAASIAIIWALTVHGHDIAEA